MQQDAQPQADAQTDTIQRRPMQAGRRPPPARIDMTAAHTGNPALQRDMPLRKGEIALLEAATPADEKPDNKNGIDGKKFENVTEMVRSLPVQLLSNMVKVNAYVKQQFEERELAGTKNAHVLLHLSPHVEKIIGSDGQPDKEKELDAEMINARRRTLEEEKEKNTEDQRENTEKTRKMLETMATRVAIETRKELMRKMSRIKKDLDETVKQSREKLHADIGQRMKDSLHRHPAGLAPVTGADGVTRPAALPRVDLTAGRRPTVDMSSTDIQPAQTVKPQADTSISTPDRLPGLSAPKPKM